MVADYVRVEDFRDYIRDNQNLDQTIIPVCITAASRSVDDFCGRHFYQTTETQYFSPNPSSLWLLALDDMDLATTDGLTVDVEFGIDGTYPETRTFGTDFIAEPINQSMNGIDGWPFTSLRAVNGKIWPPRYADFQRDTVRITGTWGWQAVPANVQLAALILAAENYKMMDAPFGYIGFGNFGTAKVRDNPKAMALLHGYRKGTTLLMA